MIRFDKSYYGKVIEIYNYNPMDFGPMDFWFGNINPNIMNSKWLCHSGINNINELKNTIITSGIGLSGTPHMGTISQILRIIFLQKQGFNVQMVLGDLDSYNARNQSFELVNKRANQYIKFIKKLGFNTEKGILRRQYGEERITQTSFLISKYLNDKDFEEAEEDLSNLYIKENVYEGITFPVKQSILLMASDFIHLGMVDKYKNIIVMLGLEEHQYVILARKILKRMNFDFNIYGMYSRIIKGLNGYPKMSKSILNSSIRVDMKPEEIKEAIINEKDNYENPDDSVIYQLMSSVSYYSVEELNNLYKLCYDKGIEWKEAKFKYADELIKICSAWEE